jgi:hypothetical protein
MESLEVLDLCVTYAAGTDAESPVLAGVSFATASDPEDAPLVVSNENAHLTVMRRSQGDLYAPSPTACLHGCSQGFIRQVRW